MGGLRQHRSAVTAPDPQLAEFLHEAGLAPASDVGIWTPLAGGVSSDIWRVDAGGRSYCVKRALAQLKVAADWRAPVERNAFEWAYMQQVDQVAPGRVPAPLAQDTQRGLFAMAWLAPEQFRLWKSELLAGRVDPADAASLGDLLGQIHEATARRADIAAAFATDAAFHDLRIDPYLLAAARAHPSLSAMIETVAKETAASKMVLVHGDVSPKNIMLGLDGPVLLDAECAWYGDPAFDLAFCLNHLIIKARIVEPARNALLQSVAALIAGYMAHVEWEPRAALERRTARLLPCLALARVDGKSPLEYLDQPQRAALRNVASAAIAAPPRDLAVATQALLADL